MRFSQKAIGRLHMFLLGLVLLILILALLSLVRCFLNLKELKKLVDKSWDQLARHLQQRYNRLPRLVDEIEILVKSRKPILKAILLTSEQADQFLRLLRDVGGPLISDMSPLLDAETRLVQLIRQLLKSCDELPPTDRADLRHPLLEISQLESRILLARQRFNHAVARYNSMQKSVPAKWMVKWGHHCNVALYQIASI